MKQIITFKRIILRASYCALLTSVFVVVAGQASHTVNVTSNVFNPAEITINQGDEIVWKNLEGSHNVDGVQSIFPSNPESFGNSVGQGWTFSHVFNIPGTYDYQCDPHAFLGMVGKVIVQEPSGLERQDEKYGISLYPNPASEWLHVSSVVGIESVTLYSLSGTPLKEMDKIGSTEYVVSLEGLNAGIYFIEVHTKDNQLRITDQFILIGEQ